MTTRTKRNSIENTREYLIDVTGAYIAGTDGKRIVLKKEASLTEWRTRGEERKVEMSYIMDESGAFLLTEDGEKIIQGYDVIYLGN